MATKSNFLEYTDAEKSNAISVGQFLHVWRTNKYGMDSGEANVAIWFSTINNITYS